ncbi:MAG: alpha-amylase, partial [Deltaproteobacteria bacterium]
LPVSFALTRKREEPSEEFLVEGLKVRLDYEWLTIRAKLLMEESPQSIIALLHVDGDEGVLFDASFDSRFRDGLLSMIARRGRLKGDGGELVGLPGRLFRELGKGEMPVNSQVVKAEQSNTSIVYEDRYYLKLFRNLKEGPHPDREIVQALTEKVRFPSIPPYAGAIEYRRPEAEPVTVALLQGYVQYQGDSWSYTLDSVGRYFEQVLSRVKETEKKPQVSPPLVKMETVSLPFPFVELIEGQYLEMVTFLGRRTGEMHLALSSLAGDPDFAPEPFSMLYQRSIYQSMRGMTRQVFELLRRNRKALPKEVNERAEKVLSLEARTLDQFKAILQQKFSAMKIRIHGDYHLGQALFTGKDFVIIDFEGEPARPLSERRIKRSPLRDVAGMIRSFHYAAFFELLREGSIRREDVPVLDPWADLWYQCVSGIFLNSYLDTTRGAPLLSGDRGALEIMLKVFLLEKAVYELGYELNNRPEWVVIPLRGIIDLVKKE